MCSMPTTICVVAVKIPHTTLTLWQGCGAACLQGNGLKCPGGQAGDMMAVRMRATKPNPSFVIAWCAQQKVVAPHAHDAPAACNAMQWLGG